MPQAFDPNKQYPQITFTCFFLWSQGNDYQMVVVTAGDKTFAFYLYINDNRFIKVVNIGFEVGNVKSLFSRPNPQTSFKDVAGANTGEFMFFVAVVVIVVVVVVYLTFWKKDCPYYRRLSNTLSTLNTFINA